MTTHDILTALDHEIARLRQVRELLAGAAQPAKRRGRPKGSSNKSTSFDPTELAPKKRVLSPEARERIAAAQRTRWAKQNAGSSVATKATSAKSAGRPAGAKKGASAKKSSARKAPGKNSPAAAPETSTPAE